MPELKWIGKDKVINHHLDVPYRVLDRKYSFDEEGQHEEDNGSENMIIHGDNLEALKSLLPKYEGKVDCIYIDPPYNTGNEKWVYNDNVNDPQIKKWLGEIVGSEGDDLSRHDKWLCMMYPRLKLLHRLLSNTGFIFISIDDNEFTHLELLCNEIFGIANKVGPFIWQKKTGASDSKTIAVTTEYVLCYAKKIEDAQGFFKRNYEAHSLNRYRYKDEYYLFRGPYYYDTLDRGSIRYSDSMNYPIIAPDGTSVYPNGRNQFVQDGWTWKWSKEKVNWGLENGFIDISKDAVTGKWIVRYKIYLNVDNSGNFEDKSSPYKNLITGVLNSDSSAELKGIFGEKKFDYPKPVQLIQHLISLVDIDEAIILDSFAGSGTTAQAVLDLNKQDGGNRKFILIELMDYADTITAERVKRVMSGYEGKQKQEDVLFSEKLNLTALRKGEDLIEEADQVREENLDKYDTVSRPAVKDDCLQVIGKKEYKEFVPGLGDSFSYYELGEPLLIDDKLNKNVELSKIREYIYYMETRQAISENISDEPELLGKHIDTAYYFYYRSDSVTTMNRGWLQNIKTKAEYYVVYADLCTLNERELQELNITFKKIPRDITKL